MIRTNLATRPFYNERAVHAALALAAIAVVALTTFNVWRILTLTRDQRDLNATIAAAEVKAAQLRSQAIRIRQGLNPQELKAVSIATSEANTIIDRRLFSWTDLFNRLETTLPDAARITSVRPQIDRQGEVQLTMTAMGREVEDIDKFVENLNATGAFSDVLVSEETVNQDGLVQTNIHGNYQQGKPPAAAEGRR
jgi:Tfp pilus assembly protein PilN